jgi:hypothetical protein
MKDTLLKINKDKISKSTGGIYHELVFCSGRKCYADPENRNYWDIGWGLVIDNYPEAKGYRFLNLVLKTGYATRYDADNNNKRLELEPPRPPELGNPRPDIMSIE